LNSRKLSYFGKEEILKAQSNNVFLFQGVGGKTYRDQMDLFSKEQMKEVAMYASQIKQEIGVDLSAYINGDDSAVERPELAEWILAYMCDYILFKEYESLNIAPDIMVGYSMGLITAMVCAQSMKFINGIKLLECIYGYPRKAKRTNETMGVIIGLTMQEVERLIEDIDLDDCVEIASENNDQCIVIGGLRNAVSMMLKVSKEYGSILAEILELNIAFHTTYGKRGVEVLEDAVFQLELNKPQTPILSLFSLEILNDKELLRRELVINMYSQMHLKNAIMKLSANGYRKFYQVSFNDNLAKACKVIDLNNTFITNLDARKCYIE
jgi:malonyl CoA-acyl carrier protein transacylase